MPLKVPTRDELIGRAAFRLAGRNIALTDLTPISALRILIEELHAEEFLALWAAIVEAAEQDWFIQKATGTALERRLADFNVAWPEAATAYGSVEVTVTGTVVIPAGVTVRTAPEDGSAPKVYQVIANPDNLLDGSWSITDAGTVTVQAQITGAAGNTAAHTVTVIQSPVTGWLAVDNAYPIVNGRDRADAAGARQHFIDTLWGYKHGTRGHLLQRIGDFVLLGNPVRRVHSVALQEWGGTTLFDAADGSGTKVALKIFISEGAHGSAHTSLVSAVQRLVDGSDTEADPGLRAAAATAAVVAAQPFRIPVALSIDAASGYNTTAVRLAVLDAVTAYFARVPISGQRITGELQGQLNFGRLFRAVMDVPGVLRAAFSTPKADMAIPVGYQAVAHNPSVTVASVT